MKAFYGFMYGAMALIVCGLFTVCSLLRADHESRDCITKSLDCNEQRPDPDPPWCPDPFSPCEGRDQSVCNAVVPTCTGPTGHDPERVPRTCVNCDPVERDGGGPCNCHHCQNDPVPKICYRIRPCFWNESRGCLTSYEVVCQTYYTSEKIAPPCVNPEFFPNPNLDPP
ncbi:MAG: hypothetical protein KatS3mg110_0709 [Pirellulaceae bacterium]|nr:MAG: hypothetical protein KatS3mg110_0709 [Pirellulaceae bacterium]